MVQLMQDTLKTKDTKIEIVRPNKEGIEEWEERIKDNDFLIQMMCITLFRYVTDHLNGAPLGVSHKIIEEYDFIDLICNLIDLKPWFKVNNKDQRC